MKQSVSETNTKQSASVEPLAPSREGTGRRNALLYWATLFFVLIAALWLRTDDLMAWRHFPERAFFDNQPILINFDGYYYLSLARDLLEGQYEPVDALRGVPQSPLRPMPPPVISLLTAGLAVITPFSLNWIATLLPPLLGLTLAIPLALIGRLYFGRVGTIVAMAMGLFPSYYAYRSHLGWFDTDCLNVSFLLLVCYLFIRFGLDRSRRRYAYLAGGLVTYIFFMFWWDQTPAVVTLICLSPLAIVVLLYYRPVGRERRAAVIVGLAALTGLAVWQGPRILIAPFQQAAGQLRYISKQQGNDFPNVGVSVHEQNRLTLNDLIKKTTGHPLSFSLGLIGLAALFWRFKKKAAVLIVPFGIGCLSFLFARRFLIFLNPFLAVGLGYTSQWLWELRNKWQPFQYATPLLIAAFLLVPFKASLGKTYWPKEIPPIVEGMDVLARTTADTAVVWAWWDHGYPLLYWAQRATINDGSLHGGVRTVVNAIPLTASSPQFAADFIQFYTVRGISGLRRLFNAVHSTAKGMHLIETVLTDGPAAAPRHITQAGLAPVEEWVDFFFPKPSRDLFLFIDLRLARTAYWWHWFGTWDAGRRDGVHPNFKFFINCRQSGHMIRGNEFEVDLEQGVVQLGDRSLALKSADIHDGQAWHRIGYPHAGDLIFVYNSRENVAALMDKAFAGTLFSRLYLFKQPDPEHFTLKAEHYPYYQVWQITP